MKGKDLSELLYKENFNVTINRKNDGNKHQNHCNYSYYSEQIRQKFLKKFGWSDDGFQENGIWMVIGDEHLRYRNSLGKGDNISIKLEIFKRRNKIYYMVYTFYGAKGDVACINTTTCGFTNSSKDEKGMVGIPDFFLDTLRNAEKS